MPVRPALLSSRLAAAAGAAVLAVAAWAQAPVPPSQQQRPVAPAGKTAMAARPAWTELTPQQQQALAPLAASWGSLSEVHKRKWLALSRNFATLPAAEQAKLHSRMTDWAALSPQQRTQARLNFGEARQLSADDKKAKWEAYQALPPEEKRKLAARAAPKTPATAAAVKPVSPQKLARVPGTSEHEAHQPRTTMHAPPVAPEPAAASKPAAP